jgi:hypothetical protein
VAESEDTPQSASADYVREIKDIAEGARGNPSAEPLADLGRVNRQQNIDLRKNYADWLLRALIAQMATADVVFVLFAQFGVHWKLSATIINVWLGATIGEVVGIVLVVAHYLFPNRD